MRIDAATFEFYLGKGTLAAKRYNPIYKKLFYVDVSSPYYRIFSRLL